jgi:hypothetical protein
MDGMVGLRLHKAEKAVSEFVDAGRPRSTLFVMTEDKREPTQRTQPKGIDPKTGKPYEPVEIPVPKRSDFDRLLKRAEKAMRRER